MNITSPEIEKYCMDHTSPLPALFADLREETYASMSAPGMQVGLLEGSFLKLIVAILQPKLIVELGTFTGFSSLAMAETLPANAKIITCDVDPRATSVAQRYWNRAPHGNQVELRLGPGLETIAKIQEPIDMAFIDADKANYTNYWEALVPKVRRGGLILVDNVLWSGRVLDPKENSDIAIHSFNEHANGDVRVERVMLPLRDGLLIARKL